MDKVATSVEAIEDEAKKILDSAESRANEILLKAREKAKKISSSKLSLDEAQAEAVTIVHKAKEKAEQTVQVAQQESPKIKAMAEAKFDEIAERIFNIVTGAKAQ